MTNLFALFPAIQKSISLKTGRQRCSENSERSSFSMCFKNYQKDILLPLLPINLSKIHKQHLIFPIEKHASIRKYTAPGPCGVGRSVCPSQACYAITCRCRIHCATSATACPLATIKAVTNCEYSWKEFCYLIQSSVFVSPGSANGPAMMALE